MYILNIASTITKMTVKELRDFLFENYYKQIGISKENSLHILATKLTEQIPDPSNAKEY